MQLYTSDLSVQFHKTWSNATAEKNLHLPTLRLMHYIDVHIKIHFWIFLYEKWRF